MDNEVRKTFWNEFAKSPFIMMRLEGSNQHAAPMTAQLDEDAEHAIWFFAPEGNRIAPGGKAMGQFVSKGHEVYACIKGTIGEEKDLTIREDLWDNSVEAWFPDGKRDPKIKLLRFDIEDAEVWRPDVNVVGIFKMMTGQPIDKERAGEHVVGAL